MSGEGSPSSEILTAHAFAIPGVRALPIDDLPLMGKSRRDPKRKHRRDSQRRSHTDLLIHKSPNGLALRFLLPHVHFKLASVASPPRISSPHIRWRERVQTGLISARARGVSPRPCPLKCAAGPWPPDPRRPRTSGSRRPRLAGPGDSAASARVGEVISLRPPQRAAWARPRSRAARR